MSPLRKSAESQALCGPSFWGHLENGDRARAGTRPVSDYGPRWDTASERTVHSTLFGAAASQRSAAQRADGDGHQRRGGTARGRRAFHAGLAQHRGQAARLLAADAAFRA